MSGIPSSALICQYTTDTQVPPDSDLPTKITLLQIHRDTVHPNVHCTYIGTLIHPTPVQTQVGPPPPTPPRVKLDPPKLSAGSDKETWELFLQSWGLQCRHEHQGEPVSRLPVQLLRPGPRRWCAQGQSYWHISDMLEAELTAEIKTLAVKVESKLSWSSGHARVRLYNPLATVLGTFIPLWRAMPSYAWGKLITVNQWYWIN